MKLLKTLALGAAISSVLLAASFEANAATSFDANNVDVKGTGWVNDAPPATGTDPKTKSQSFTYSKMPATGWVSPLMSYKGWTHQSGWLLIDAVKGKPITISVDATVGAAGFHPGLTVWYKNLSPSIKASNPKARWMNDHFYYQSKSINVLNAKSDNDANLQPLNAAVGNIVMDYVASAYDATNLGDKFAVDSGTTPFLRIAKNTVAASCKTSGGVAVTPTPADQATCEAATAGNVWTPAVSADAVTYGPYVSYPVASALAGSTPVTGTTGKTSLTFTPEKTGVYQVAIGGLNPDAGSPASGKATCTDTTGTAVTATGATLNAENCVSKQGTAGTDKTKNVYAGGIADVKVTVSIPQ